MLSREFSLVEAAPAKINLALAVTGQRADGYHLLDSLVTFTAFGDRIGFSPAAEDRFTLSGRFAGGLAGGGNLVLAARDRLRAALEKAGRAAPPVHIHLEKNLPVAAGIGGGSADAAATLRGLVAFWQADPPRTVLDALAIGLGADVPMCLESRPLVARGVGEEIVRLAMPALSLVLANPLVGVSTPAVFAALADKRNPPLDLPGAATDAGWAALIARLRNDLEPPARSLCGAISAVSDSLAASGAGLVRMSGSGATCFGLYSSQVAAQSAAEGLARRHPDWFIVATTTLCEDGGHGRD